MKLPNSSTYDDMVVKTSLATSLVNVLSCEEALDGSDARDLCNSLYAIHDILREVQDLQAKLLEELRSEAKQARPQ